MKKWLVAASAVAGIVVLGSTPIPTAKAQVRAAITQDVDQPGRNTFTLRSDTFTGGSVTFTVPAGKRYVIEQYTGDCGTPNTDSLIDVEVITNSDGVQAFFHTPVHYVENVGFGLVRYAGTGQGPIYADPGTQIIALAKVASALNANFRGCTFVVSGHVINNP